MSNLQKAIEAVNDETIKNARKCHYCTRPAEYIVESQYGHTYSFCYMDKFFYTQANPEATVTSLTLNGRGY